MKTLVAMKKKIAAAVILVSLMAIAISASALELTTHFIEVEVDETGFARVTEEYQLKFDTVFEVESFKEQVGRNSSSLLAWQADYPFFYPRFGQIAENIIERSSVTYEEETKKLALNYVLANRFAQIKEDAPRETKWAVPSKNLRAFEDDGVIIIPENVSAKIILPRTAQKILAEPKASIRQENNTVLLSGLSTSFFSLEYSTLKPLSSTLNISEILSDFFSSTPNILMIIIAVTVLVAAYVKRKTITQKIEDYIVEHSHIEHSEPEEEIDLEP